jgi:hypothetical protein
MTVKDSIDVVLDLNAMITSVLRCTCSKGETKNEFNSGPPNLRYYLDHPMSANPELCFTIITDTKEYALMASSKDMNDLLS